MRVMGLLERKRFVWGHHEENVFAEVEESLCREASGCEFAEEGVRLGMIFRGSPTEGAAHHGVRGFQGL